MPWLENKPLKQVWCDNFVDRFECNAYVELNSYDDYNGYNSRIGFNYCTASNKMAEMMKGRSCCIDGSGLTCFHGFNAYNGCFIGFNGYNCFHDFQWY